MSRFANEIANEIASARLLVGVVILLISSSALSQADDECQCRAPGGDMHNLGTVHCVEIAGRSKIVQCVMSTNTPYWKDVEQVDGCPLA